ncbi:DUF2239 family protein [Pelagerythrobacter marensis]|uniref:DUF2239 family protein n=1 Tax=Pelagerythrobacter marensis TaxID=543877 RepID=A0ABZ2D6Y6_9SPHN
MTERHTHTAFVGERLLATGSAADVALAVKAASPASDEDPIRIFDNRTGRMVDFDLRGSDEEVAARLAADSENGGAKEAKRSRGRPKLGVVAREVTLLPRHWEWLAAQPGGASVTLRKLVEAARKNDPNQTGVRQAQAAADRFMLIMCGNEPGFEEATRALYAGDKALFLSLTKGWPKDLRDHARQLAEPAFITSGES